MKITKGRLKQIITEEMGNLRRNPNGGTSLSEAQTPTILAAIQLQNEAKRAAMALLDASKEFAQMPSHEPASSVASFVEKKANLIVDVMVEQGRHLTSYHNYQNDLAEGDDHSRTITQIETIGDVVLEVVGMVDNPEAVERLERVDQMVTDLLAQMQGVSQGADADGYSKIAGQRPMQEDLASDTAKAYASLDSALSQAEQMADELVGIEEYISDPDVAEVAAQSTQGLVAALDATSTAAQQLVGVVDDELGAGDEKKTQLRHAGVPGAKSVKEIERGR